MSTDVPAWLTALAWVCLTVSVLAAGLVVNSLVADRRTSRADAVVWATSALYLGPVAVALHRAHRRTGNRPPGARDAASDLAVAGLPGGSASAIAHLVGVPLVIVSGLTIAGTDLWVMILVIAVLATALLATYERTAGRSTHGSPSVPAALASAALTVLAFDLGMGGWMLLLHYRDFMPPASDGVFWFLMQIGVLLGLLTGAPVVRWLARRSGTVTPPCPR